MAVEFDTEQMREKPPEKAPSETLAIRVTQHALYLWRRASGQWNAFGVIDSDAAPDLDLEKSTFKGEEWVYADQVILPSISVSVQQTEETEDSGDVTQSMSEKAVSVAEACRRLASSGQQEVTIETIAQQADLGTRSAGMVLAQSRDKFTGVTVEPIEPGEWRLIPAPSSSEE